MEPILYWYPVAYQKDGRSGDTAVKHERGKIIPYRLTGELHEMAVEARGCSFHLIFGDQINGMFLCIPNWDIGCELSSLTDRHWNRDSLLKTGRIDFEECNAIVWALSSIADLLRLLHREPGSNKPSKKINHAGGLE